MSLGKFEIWVHDHILKNDAIRHFSYGLYQRILWLFSPKFKFEGDIKQLTPNDGFEYLFGYYDKCPWSPNEKYILALKVKDASKKADSKDKAELVIIDVETLTSQTIATTSCWNVQQGCMAQWLSNEEVLYNDFRDENFISIILNLVTKEERIIYFPIYTVSKDKKTALSLDFTRLHRLRPGYGYCNKKEETRDNKCPNSTCIWKIDLASGEINPVLNYTDFANFEPKETMKDAEHKVNHLMLSPDGKRFMVLHRWFKNKVKFTRLVTCNIDGSDMFNLSDDDFVSHCCWKNNDEILSYLNKKETGKGYYLMKDKSVEYKQMWPELIMDGHPTYSYDGKMIATDTYPDRRRIQSIFVMQGNNVQKIAKVFSPFKYGGDTRCDLHPRWSTMGDKICFDGSFNGKRGVFMVNNPIKIDDNLEKLNKNPLISVVIPTHNRDYLLPRALESALRQSYKNIEVVVVSDGSTDKTDEIMQKYEEIDARVKYISYKPGKGGNFARNTGIQNSNGEYVAFLDDDDEWYPEKLQKQLDIFLSDSQIGLVCTGINSIQEGENFTTRFIPPAVYDSSKLILLRNCVGSTTTVMVRKNLFHQSGMFDEKLGALQDYDLWVRLCQICKVGVVKEPCVDYWNYKTSGQISGCTDKYEKAVDYLGNKYRDLVQTLTEDEKNRRKQYFILLLAKKAMRNGDKKLSRKYVRQARKIKFTKEVIACYFATYFSDHFVNRIKSIMRKSKERK